MHKKIIYLLLLTLSVFAESKYKNVQFEGLSQISKTIALETSGFEPNNVYTQKRINKAIKEFFKFGYFNDIVVSSENNILIFHFQEKPFIAKLEMSGYKTREDDLDILYNAIGIKKGNMYSQSKIDQAKEKLLQQLEQEGYMNSVVEVEIDNISPAAVSVKFIVNKGDEIIIKRFNYEGAKELDKSDFEKVAVNKQQESFSWSFGRNSGEMNFEQLEYDGFRIKETYLENGFLDAKVEQPFSKIDFNTNTATIDVGIEEGKQYKVNNIVIYLDENITSPDDIYPELKLKKEKVFNIKKLRVDVDYIKTTVSDKGYAFAQVKYDIRKDKEKGTADIIYNVIPGDKVYINDVIISGNSRTLDRVIRRNVYLAPKDLFSLTDFKDSQSALNRTGFFDNTKIEQQRIAKDKMNLIVTVQEAPTGNLIFGGGYGSYDGFMINASINDKNIFGSGLNLGFSLDWSKMQTSYNISLSNPAIRDSKYSGSISAYKNESEISYTDYELVTEKTGMMLGVGKGFNRHTRIGANYSLTQTEEKKINTADNNSTTYLDYVTSSVIF